jgi:hypothetical protein
MSIEIKGGAGGGGASFSTIQTDSGTNPVATGSDTLTVAGVAGQTTVTGDATTDTVTIGLANPLTNLEIADSSSFVNQSDATKKLSISLGGVTTAAEPTLVFDNTASDNIKMPSVNGRVLSSNLVEKHPFLHDEFFGFNDWSAPGGVASAGFTGSYAANRPGQIRLQTTSNTTASLYKEGYHFFGGGVYEYRLGLWISNLSDATNNFTVRVGIGDSFTSTDHTNGAYFEYNHGLNSGNWVGKTAKGGSLTSVNSAIAVAATTWYDLKFVVNAAATSVEFFVDGVSMGSSATNIPNTTSNLCAPIFHQIRTATASSAGRYVVLDYIEIFQDLTTRRS